MASVQHRPVDPSTRRADEEQSFESRSWKRTKTLSPGLTSRGDLISPLISSTTPGAQVEIGQLARTPTDRRHREGPRRWSRRSARPRKTCASGFRTCPRKTEVSPTSRRNTSGLRPRAARSAKTTMTVGHRLHSKPCHSPIKKVTPCHKYLWSFARRSG